MLILYVAVGPVTRDKAVHLLYRGLLAFVYCVNITVRCCLEVRVTHDGLDCLDVLGGVIEQGSQRVPEHMGGGTMHINRLLDALEHQAIDCAGNRFLATLVAYSNDDIACGLQGLEVIEQIRRDGDVALAGGCLRLTNDGLAPVDVCTALDMDDVIHQVDVLPPEADDFTPSHARVQRQREEPAVILLKQVELACDFRESVAVQGLPVLARLAGVAEAGTLGGIVRDEVILHGGVENLLEQVQHLTQGLGREVAAGIQEFLDILGGNLVDWRVAPCRIDMALQIFLFSHNCCA